MVGQCSGESLVSMVSSSHEAVPPSDVCLPVQLNTSQADLMSVVNQHFQSLSSISTSTSNNSIAAATITSSSSAVARESPRSSVPGPSRQNQASVPRSVAAQREADDYHLPVQSLYEEDPMPAPQQRRSDGKEPRLFRMPDRAAERPRREEHKSAAAAAQAALAPPPPPPSSEPLVLPSPPTPATPPREIEEDDQQQGPATTTSFSRVVDLLFPSVRDIDFGLPCDAFYVNLDRSEDRRAVFERTFGKLWGNKLHRHRGVDVQNKTQVLETIGNTERGREIAGFATPQIGCILSHLTAVRTAYLSGAEVALIVEDDIGPYLMPYWTIGLGDIVSTMKEKKEPWDTVMLWWATEEGPTPHENATWISKNVIKSPYLWGTSAYLISRKGMQKVIDRHFPEGKADSPCVLTWEGETTIDGTGYYAGMMTENYIVYPGMFITHSKRSTIQTDSWHFDFHAKMGAGHWTESMGRWQNKYYPELQRRR